MKKSRFSDSQIMHTLNRVETGLSVPDVCRGLGMLSIGKNVSNIHLSDFVNTSAMSWASLSNAVNFNHVLRVYFKKLHLK